MIKNNNKVIFITWTTYSPHSLLLSEAFNSKIFYVENLINSRGLLWKLLFLFDYIYKAYTTISIINKQSPNIVIMQSPPTLTPIVIVLYSFIKRYKTVIDSHNGAFEKPWDSIPFYKWILRKADIVIVHNQQLKNNLLINEDYRKINFKLLNSRLSDYTDIKKDVKSYILVVSSFSGDEPMEILLEGISLFNKNNPATTQFKITGNYSKKPDLFNKYKHDSGIEFLGFVSTEHYRQLVVNAEALISMSTRDDVQQFALMEAVGAETPFISNSNQTNQMLFKDSMILVDISPEKIAVGLTMFFKNKFVFTDNIKGLKSLIKDKWETDFLLIKSELGV